MLAYAALRNKSYGIASKVRCRPVGRGPTTVTFIRPPPAFLRTAQAFIKLESLGGLTPKMRRDFEDLSLNVGFAAPFALRARQGWLTLVPSHRPLARSSRATRPRTARPGL